MDLVESHERCIVLWLYHCAVSSIYWTSLFGYTCIFNGDVMNERIKELARQAEFSENDLHTQGDNFQYFAELIVRECAEVSEDDISDGDACCTNTADRIARQIKKHFGVE